MHPTTKEIVSIDTDKIKDWKDKFLHRSWKPFEEDVEVKVRKLKELSEEELEGIVASSDDHIDEEDEQVSIEELRDRYEDITDKKLSFRFQNDREWILEAIDKHLNDSTKA